MRARFVAILPWMLLIVAIVAWGMAFWFDRGSDEVTGRSRQAVGPFLLRLSRWSGVLGSADPGECCGVALHSRPAACGGWSCPPGNGRDPRHPRPGHTV